MKKVALLCLGLAMGAANAAEAQLTMQMSNGWSFTFAGNVNAFAIYESQDADGATLTPGGLVGPGESKGFNVRTGNYHVFKSKTVICGAGGASNIFKPRSVGEGSGRTWYAPWSSASAYGLMINAGAKMTQMENRIVLARFKDGYGPVGAYFLHLKTYTQNALGEEYESKWFPALQKMVGKEYLDPEVSHLTHRPIPPCLRNHCIISEVAAGRGPIHMVTMQAFQDPHLEEVGWENFLGMTVGQAVLWAATDVDPKNENPELTTSEPYVMGSHATCSGAWASGPEDYAPDEYQWGYNRMMTVDGLFGAGDTIGGTTGNNGSIRAHNPSGTTHGGC